MTARRWLGALVLLACTRESSPSHDASTSSGTTDSRPKGPDGGFRFVEGYAVTCDTGAVTAHFLGEPPDESYPDVLVEQVYYTFRDGGMTAPVDVKADTPHDQDAFSPGCGYALLMTSSRYYEIVQVARLPAYAGGAEPDDIIRAYEVLSDGLEDGFVECARWLGPDVIKYQAVGCCGRPGHAPRRPGGPKVTHPARQLIFPLPLAPFVERLSYEMLVVEWRLLLVRDAVIAALAPAPR
jgi:hypothetical protein